MKQVAYFLVGALVAVMLSAQVQPAAQQVIKPTKQPTTDERLALQTQRLKVANLALQLQREQSALDNMTEQLVGLYSVADPAIETCRLDSEGSILCLMKKTLDNKPAK